MNRAISGDAMRTERVTVGRVTDLAFDGGLAILEREELIDGKAISAGLVFDLGEVAEPIADSLGVPAALVQNHFQEWLAEHGPDHVSDLLWEWRNSLDINHGPTG